ncbi:MAG: hypothetical protein V4463_13075 [Pseudomonadota bacterium]
MRDEFKHESKELRAEIEHGDNALLQKIETKSDQLGEQIHLLHMKVVAIQAEMRTHDKRIGALENKVERLLQWKLMLASVLLAAAGIFGIINVAFTSGLLSFNVAPAGERR